MNTRSRAQRPLRETAPDLLPALTEVPTRQARERHDVDIARRVLARWFGEGAEPAVRGDK